MDPKAIPTSEHAIRKLAQKQFKKRSVSSRRNASISYREGDPEEKVWDNYQLTKGLKRQFKELCAKKNIVASKYLRACITVFIKNNGDVKKSLEEVEKMDLSPEEE